VVLSCVVNGQNKLSLPVLDAVVRAAKQVGLKPCAGKKLRAVREGRKMVFEPEHLVDTDLAKSFADTLRGLLPAERELPSEVIFRCGK
jgi:hypothetical protein